MKKTTRSFSRKILPAFLATLFVLPATFAQEPVRLTGPTQPAFGQMETAPMGILKGRIVDSLTREPMTDINVRLIGYQAEALTNARGEFFLEAPAKTYAGLVMELPGNGQMRLFEKPVAMNPGQFMDLDQIAIETLFEKEPLQLPTPAATTVPQPQAQPQQTMPTDRLTGQMVAMGPNANLDPNLNPNQNLNPTQAPNQNDFGVADQVNDTVGLLALNGPTGPTPTLDAPAGPAPGPDLPTVLLNARAMTEQGNFFGAERAYEEYLARFPNDGPVAVEYGVMVYHNIQNARGRTILKQASELPGLRPMDIDALNRYLTRTAIIVHEPEYRPHVKVRLRNRHRSCH